MIDTGSPKRPAIPVRRLLTIAALLLAVVSCGKGQVRRILHDSGDARVLVTVAPPISCTPLGTIDTILVVVRNNSLKSIFIQNYTMQPDQGPANPFSMRTAINATLLPRAARTDTLYFDASKVPIGQYAAHIDINRSNGHTDFTVYAEVSPPAALALDSIPMFETQGPGDADAECFSIVNPSCDTLIISDIDVQAPFKLAPSTRLPDTLAARGRGEICVQYVDTEGPGAGRDVRGNIRITMADGSIINRQLHGRRLPRPMVEAIPGRVIFIGVPANSLSDTTINVRVVNRGNMRDSLMEVEVFSQDPGVFIVTPPSLPARLNPNNAETLAIGVRFAPRDAGLYIGRLALRFAKGGVLLTVELRGDAAAGSIAANARQIDLGNVFTGDSIRQPDTLRLFNSGTKPIDVAAIDFAGPDSAFFKLIRKGPPSIPPGGELAYDITFKPGAAREYACEAVVHLRNGGRLPVTIRGRGVVRPPEIRAVWVDSTRNRIPVNELFTLTAHIAPDLVPSDNLTKFRLICRIDHRALYPHGIIKTFGARDTIYYRSADTVVFERLDGPPIIGGDLASINFEGLVTGQPENAVEVVDAQFPGRTVALTTGNGNASLEGCDVGTGLDYSKPIAARSVWPVPAREEVTISYVAAEGSRPWTRIVDAVGRTMRETALPEGTGGVQTTTVATRGLGPGAYFVELHAEGEMSVVRMMVGSQ